MYINRKRKLKDKNVKRVLTPLAQEATGELGAQLALFVVHLDGVRRVCVCVWPRGLLLRAAGVSASTCRLTQTLGDGVCSPGEHQSDDDCVTICTARRRAFGVKSAVCG